MRSLVLAGLLMTTLTVSACAVYGPASPNYASRNWEAWVDHQEPGLPSLHVRGELNGPGHGYSAYVTRVEGVNPRQLVLAVDLEKTRGDWADHTNPVEVRWDYHNYDGGHDTVMVLPGDGSGIVVDIEQLQSLRRHVPAERPPEDVQTNLGGPSSR